MYEIRQTALSRVTYKREGDVLFFIRAERTDVDVTEVDRRKDCWGKIHAEYIFN